MPSGLLIDKYIFHSFSMIYLLLGMTFSTTAANTVSEDVLTETMRAYSPLLSLSFVVVIVILGMHMDCPAAIINEIIAVIAAIFAFKLAGEIK